MARYTLDDLAQMVDHTNLKPYATDDDMRRLCAEARQYHFRMVAVNQVQSRLCAQELAGSDVHIGAAISFPLGQTSIAAKEFETQDAIANGATEIDYVINLTRAKAHDWDYIREEMKQMGPRTKSRTMRSGIGVRDVHQGGEGGDPLGVPPQRALREEGREDAPDVPHRRQPLQVGEAGGRRRARRPRDARPPGEDALRPRRGQPEVRRALGARLARPW